MTAPQNPDHPRQPGVQTDAPQQPGVTTEPPKRQPGVTTERPKLPHPDPLPDIKITDPDGWRAVPQALRESQFAFDNAAFRWGTLRKSLLDRRLSENDLGIIGKVEGIIDDYNRALETIDGKAKTGQQILTDSGNTLRTVADVYENLDQSYYESFGYLGDQLNQPSPPR